MPDKETLTYTSIKERKQEAELTIILAESS